MPARKLSYLGFALLFLSACAHPISTHMTANRFDSPEVSGKFGSGDLDGGFESGPEYMITPDATANPPDFVHTSFNHSDLDGFLAGDLGLLDRLDVGLKIRFNNTTLAQAKYQILGDTRKDAKDGNFSLAVSVAGGGATHNDTSTESFILLGTPITATSALTETDLDTAIIAGFRFSPSALIYGGPFWTRRTFSGNITQAGGATGNFAFSGFMQDVGLNAGIQGNVDRLILRIEGAGSRASVSSSHYLSGYFGINGGVTW